MPEDLYCLREKLRDMGKCAEYAILRTVQAVLEQDNQVARQVISADDEIDRMENELDTLATEFLVLGRPAEYELRTAVTIIHAAPVIERIADHAANIAKHALVLNLEPESFYHVSLYRLVIVAQEMVHDSLEAIVDADAEKARRTLRKDSTVDTIYRTIYHDLVAYMERHPDAIRRGTELLFIIKHLERIADYSTNLCEMVIFMVEGRMIKHTREAS